jgi:hypothetical protein
MKIDSPSITGSFAAQNGLTSSLFGTASWAQSASQALTSSYFVSASDYVLNSATSSFVQNNQTSSLSVATASYVNTLNQDVTITGTLTVGGEISGIQGQVTAIATRNYLFSGF